MSRDNWARLVEATVKREELRKLAFCPSFSTCSSIDDSSSQFSLEFKDFEAYRVSTDTFIPEASSGQSIIPSRRVYSIKFEEIKKATKNFHPDLFLGDGRFGPVYKGWINGYNMTAEDPESGLTVAIKKWKVEGLEVMREWLNEIKFASKRQMEVHPNVVRLIAHSYGEGDLFLVYQFMPNANNIEEVYRVYTIEFEEIKKATKNFQPDLILGEGRFARVHKGWFHENNMPAAKPGSGLTVAVKKRKLEGFKGLKEWLNEIKFLSKLQHPNLVKLIAHSSGEDSLILVYEFMPYGCLDYHLFERKDQSLSWAKRMKVATGVSRALSFLHSKEIQVIHRYFMPSNILLDREYNAKLNGFGLAIDGPIGDMTYVSTEFMWTYGYYAAPEYMATGHLTAKCDVYCFGVILLELLIGRRALDMSKGPDQEGNIMAWTQPYLRQKSKLKRIMDRKLEGQYPKKGAYIVASLVSKCLSSDPTKRPTMAEVLVALENLEGV